MLNLNLHQSRKQIQIKKKASDEPQVQKIATPTIKNIYGREQRNERVIRNARTMNTLFVNAVYLFSDHDLIILYKMLDIDKVAHKLTHSRNLRKLLEVHETRTASIALRKKWHDKQKHNNYMNKYNRIRGELSKSVLKGSSKAHLENRKQIRVLRSCSNGYNSLHDLVYVASLVIAICLFLCEPIG